MKFLLGIVLAVAGVVALPFASRLAMDRHDAATRELMQVQVARARAALDPLDAANTSAALTLSAEALTMTELSWLLSGPLPGVATHSWPAVLRHAFDTGEGWRALRAGVGPARLTTAQAVAEADAQKLAASVDVGAAGSTVTVAEGRPRMLTLLRPRGALLGSSVSVLATRPLEDAVLMEWVARAGGAMLLSDGARALTYAGPPEEVGRLAKLLGRERAYAADKTFFGPHAEWAALVLSLGEGVWTWVYVDGTEALLAGENQALIERGKVWGACALLTLVGLALIVSGRKRSPAPSVTSENPALVGPVPEPRLASQTGRRSDVSGERSAAAVRQTLNTLEPDSGVDSSAEVSDISDERASGARRRVTISNAATIALGRYTLIHRMSEGGMAEIYSSVSYGSEGFRRRFVVKRLRPELLSNDEAVMQFVDEAKLAASLVHSNILPVFDFGRVGDEYFLASEYILGRDMSRLTARMMERFGHGLPVPLVLRCASETLKALAFAHEKIDEEGRPLGVVHRDIAPGNIMVSTEGEVKLLDFGIVKTEVRRTKTQQGLVKGNLNFMAPEQARGLAVDLRSDLFSLGLVIFYAVTGEPLYRGDTEYERLNRAAAGLGVEELTRLHDLPSPLPGILSCALSTDPKERFQSATEFRAALTPHFRENSADLAQLVEALCGDELRAEEAAFNHAVAALEQGQTYLMLTQQQRKR